MKPKLKNILMILLPLWLVISNAIFGLAAGIVPKEDFELTPEQGKFWYSENIKFEKGKEYVIIGEIDDSYIIKYEVLKGIRVMVYVPRSKVDYKKLTEMEELEQKEQECLEEFEAEQRAKGLVKIGKHWVSTESAELWARFKSLKKLRVQIKNMEKKDKKDETALLAGHEKIIKINDSIISMQEKGNSMREWLENHPVSKSSPSRDIGSYNVKVTEYNRLGGEIKSMISDIKKTELFCKEKQKEIERNRDKYQDKKSEYTKKFLTFEEDIKSKGSNAEDTQKKFIEYIAKQASLLRKEFMSHIVQVRQVGGGTLVNGRVNDKLDLLFVVDTGATYISISESMVTELDLDINSGTPRCNVRLADGSVREVAVVVLASVNIGGVEQSDVQAVVLEDSPNFTPLLGMSFLKHFDWHFQGKNGIVFEKIKIGNDD